MVHCKLCYWGLYWAV